MIGRKMSSCATEQPMKMAVGSLRSCAMSKSVLAVAAATRSFVQGFSAAVRLKKAELRVSFSSAMNWFRPWTTQLGRNSC